MANTLDEQFKRITVRSVKDRATKAYAVADYDRDRGLMEKALRSALPADAFYHVTPKDINYNATTGVAKNQIGKMTEHFYVKEQYAEVAQKAIAQAINKMKFSGGTQSKYKTTKLRDLTDEENNLVKSLEEIAKNKDANKETETTRFHKGTFLKILGTLTLIANITRRILSSILSRASQSVQDTITAHNLGTSYENVRQYRHVEERHGLKEGTITGALSDIQGKFGNITTLDEASLEALAVVMGGKIEEMATMGLGSSNPEKILESILDTFNEKANAGVNSIGQYVGEQQARKELYSYLLKISPQIADIFATMQEEQHNINSLFRNQADTFAEWKNAVPTARGFAGDPARTNVLVELGQEWNVLKEVIEQVRDAIAVSLAPALLKLLRRIADSRIGMTQSEKEERNKENKQANEQFISSAKATMTEMEKNWDVLEPEQKARYYALQDAVREAETANKGTGLFSKKIAYAVPTQEELQVATQSIIYEQAKERAQLGKDESAYRYLNDITEDEIKETAENNAYDINKAREAYNKARASETKGYQKRLDDYNKKLKDEEDKIFKEKESEANLSKAERIKRAEKEAISDMTAEMGDLEYAKMNPTERSWEMTIRSLEKLYGVELRTYGADGKLSFKDTFDKAKKLGLIAKNMKGIDIGAKYDKLPTIKQEPEKWRQEAKAEALERVGEAPIYDESEDFPSFWMWMYKHDSRFFNEKVLLKRADKLSGKSKLDPYYDLTLLHQDYGADLSGVLDKLPVGYTNENASIFSMDERGANGLVTHKIVLDLNNNGKKEASDVLLESFTTNRTGHNGTLVDKVEIKDNKVIPYSRPASDYRKNKGDDRL